MNELKLYTLSVAKNKNSLAEYLSSSHSIDKLKSSIYNGGSPWYVHDDGGGCNSSTVTNEYPMYFINEVNFII